LVTFNSISSFVQQLLAAELLFAVGFVILLVSSALLPLGVVGET